MKDFLGIFLMCFFTTIIIMTLLGDFFMNNIWGIIILISTIFTVFISLILSLVSRLDSLESKIDKLSNKIDAE